MSWAWIALNSILIPIWAITFAHELYTEDRVVFHGVLALFIVAASSVRVMVHRSKRWSDPLHRRLRQAWAGSQLVTGFWIWWVCMTVYPQVVFPTTIVAILMLEYIDRGSVQPVFTWAKLALALGLVTRIGYAAADPGHTWDFGITPLGFDIMPLFAPNISGQAVMYLVIIATSIGVGTRLLVWWHAKRVNDVIAGLSANGVIQSSTTSGNPASIDGGSEIWHTHEGRVINTTRFAALAGLILAVPLGRFESLTGLLVIIPVYAMWWLIVSEVHTALILRRLFHWFDVRPQLFHPDQRNGFQPLARYALHSMVLVVLLWTALAVAVGTTLRVTSGANTGTAPDQAVAATAPVPAGSLTEVGPGLARAITVAGPGLAQAATGAGSALNQAVAGANGVPVRPVTETGPDPAKADANPGSLPDQAGTATASLFGKAVDDVGSLTGEEVKVLMTYAFIQLFIMTGMIAAVFLLATWEAHQAMKDTRTTALMPFANQIRDAASSLARETSIDGQSRYVDGIAKLRANYDAVLRSCPVWPLGAGGLRRKILAPLFVLSSFLPLLGPGNAVFEVLDNAVSRSLGL